MIRILISLTLIGVFLIIMGCCDETTCPEVPTNPGDLPYEVDIDPVDFLDNNINGNTFFPIIPGTKMVYEGENEDGEEVVVIDSVTAATVEIMGVTCVVVHVVEWEDGEIVEITDDWYAQDTSGNIWYFGEYSEEIEDGEVVSTEGSWEAGVDGALPGIIMWAEPVIGVWYRQEYYEGEAEDVAQILSLSADVSVPYGDYEDCLQTAEWSLLEPGIVEHKFYAAGIGLLRAVAVEGESGFEDLVSITAE